MKVLHTTKTRLSSSHVGLMAHVPPGGTLDFNDKGRNFWVLNFQFQNFLG